jgi:hypothetical protein
MIRIVRLLSPSSAFPNPFSISASFPLCRKQHDNKASEREEREERSGELNEIRM